MKFRILLSVFALGLAADYADACKRERGCRERERVVVERHRVKIFTRFKERCRHEVRHEAACNPPVCSAPAAYCPTCPGGVGQPQVVVPQTVVIPPKPMPAAIPVPQAEKPKTEEKK